MTDTLKLPYEEAAAMVESQAMEFLLLHKDPAKTTDLTSSVNSGAVTPRVIREVLAHSPKFVQINRKWDIAVRHTLGHVTMERAISSILDAFGKPLSLDILASELALVMGRTPEHYTEILPQFMKNRVQFAVLPDNRWARQEWLLKTSASDEDVLFDNFFMSPEEDELEGLRSLAEKHTWNSKDLVGSAIKFLDRLSEPISHRVLTYFAWRASPANFEPGEFLVQLESRPNTILLPGCRWCPAALRSQFAAVYHELGQREEEALPPDETEAVIPIAPLEIGIGDLEQIYALIAGSDRSWSVPELVETAFDRTEGDRGYEEAVQQLNRLMVEDERFLWVGTARWREANTLPEFIFDVPEELTIQQYIFEDENQEPIDIELEDRGIDDGLVQAMSSLLVQDFGDRDANDENAGEELTAFDLWLTRHHRDTGTLPVLPAYRGLFPEAPDIIELVMITNTGHRFPVWLNDTLETLYGFGQWFVEADLPQSGAVFTVSRTQMPGEYRLEYLGASEPNLLIDSQRMDELELLKLEAEGENPLATYHILQRIMEPYGTRGANFVRIWAEVNVVRRTTRLLLASLLSAYQCFNPVARGGDVWSYDPKRAPMGINKQKRKYIQQIG